MFQTLSFLFSSSNRFFHEMKSFELFGSSRQRLPANGFWLLVVILAAPQFFPLFILFDYICRANRSEFLSYRYFQSLNNNFETKWNEKTSNKSNFRFECGVSAYFTLFTIYCVCFISLQMNNFFLLFVVGVFFPPLDQSEKEMHGVSCGRVHAFLMLYGQNDKSIYFAISLYFSERSSIPMNKIKTKQKNKNFSIWKIHCRFLFGVVFFLIL